jgi:hypothetical protein
MPPSTFSCNSSSTHSSALFPTNPNEFKVGINEIHVGIKKFIVCKLPFALMNGISLDYQEC